MGLEHGGPRHSDGRYPHVPEAVRVALSLYQDSPAGFPDFREPPLPVEADVPLAALPPCELLCPVPLPDRQVSGVQVLLRFGEIRHEEAGHPAPLLLGGGVAGLFQKLHGEALVEAVLLYAVGGVGWAVLLPAGLLFLLRGDAVLLQDFLVGPFGVPLVSVELCPKGDEVPALIL